MLNRRQKSVDIFRPVETIDEYKQKTITYEFVGKTDMAINYLDYTKMNVNDVNYTQVTHIGLTVCQDVKVGFLVVLSGINYSIEYINANNRNVILYLKQIEV